MYSRINWEDAPSVNTPIDAFNLNKMDEGIFKNAQDVDYLNQNKADKTALALESARIDNLANNTGTTVNDLELQDIRVGADGKTYVNAGTAMREQMKNLKTGIDANTASLNEYKNSVDEILLSKTVSGTFINVNDSADWHTLDLNIKGKTVVTPAKPELPISPDNIATIVSEQNFDVVSCNVNIAKEPQYLVATRYNNCVLTKGDLFPNTQYTISLIIPNGETYYTNEKLFNQVIVNGNGTRKSITVTTKEKVSKSNVEQYNITHGWRIFKNHIATDTSGNAKDLLIELGEVLTDYVPHKEDKINIPFTMRSLPNGVSDWIKDGNHIKNITPYSFDGTEIWVKSSVTTVDRYILWGTRLPVKPKNNSAIICSHFSAISIDASGSLGINYAEYGTSTLEDFKSFLAQQKTLGTPVNGLYEVETPIITPLNTYLKTYKGITNIYTIAGAQPELTVKYAQDPNIVISNLTNALLSIGGSL